MDGGIDRISSLPDQILEHILSFLSTKQVVRTCILSKRWRRTWASVPVLNFDLDEFIIDDPVSDESFRACLSTFEQFVDYVLDNKEPIHLDTFRLICGSYRIDSKPLRKWLDCIPLQMPNLVHLNISADFHLSDSLFHCKSIQNLQLEVIIPRTITMITKTKSINLSHLKCLRLCALRQLGDDFKTMLFQGCPLLEDLALDHCELDLSEISSKLLKKLELKKCYQSKNLHISCPGLVSLVMVYSCRQIRGELSISYMPSLVNAFISFSYLGNYDNIKLLSSCSNVTSLTFVLEYSPLKLKVENVFDQFKAFNNLKSLRISLLGMCSNFDLVAKFLQNSPRLQELTLDLELSWNCKYKLEEQSSDVIFLREYLDNIIIETDHRTTKAKIDLLLKTLHACVRTIGKIVIIPSVY